ncbi:MAG: riboflavin biosynthesis protein RibF [Clostridia bacterium]
MIKKTVLALGYFDAIHKGHQYLLEKAKEIAIASNCELLVGTFDDSLYQKLGRGDNKGIFLLQERKQILQKFGCENVQVFETTKEFLSISEEEFVEYLCKFNPYCVVVGNDYRFGKNATGNANSLQILLKKRDIKTKIIDLLFIENEKVSTTHIRNLLANGEIKTVNNLLGFDYFIIGKVVTNRKVGREIGFPTANINIPSNKFMPKFGVYSSIIEVDGIKYRGITNIGTHPTFNDENSNIESFILDFDKKIYNKEIIIFLQNYIRGIFKFSSSKQLSKQINKDIEQVKKEIIL